MKKKTLKIILIFVWSLIFISILLFSNQVFAAASSLTALIDDPAKTTPEGELTKITNPILTMLQIIAAGLAFGFIIYDGIKLVTTTDNSERANLKRKIAYYVIGGLLVFVPVSVIKMLSGATAVMG